MLAYILYVVNLIRLHLMMFRKKITNRFVPGTPEGDLADHEGRGMLASQSDWFYSTPNMERKENMSIFASDSHNKMACSLQLKWRPDSDNQLTTLLSKLSLELGDSCYDYANTITYAPTRSTIRPNYITQYGAQGSSLKFFIINPYRQWRIVFRGYMSDRKSPEKLYYVKLNLLMFVTSNVYDFKGQFDAKLMAKQVALKRPKKGLDATMSDLILHDRHEHLVQLTGEYSIQQQNESNHITKDKIYLWGFHVRLFVDESTQLMRSKRILGHFENGRAFHSAFCENIKNKFSASEQFELGYACIEIGSALSPLTKHDGQQVNWDEINSGTLMLKFDFATKQRQFRVEGKLERSRWFSFTCVELKGLVSLPAQGWGIILINDGLDSTEELQEMELSKREYQRQLKAREIMEIGLTSKDLPVQVMEKKPLVVSLEDEHCCNSQLVGAKAASLAQLKGCPEGAAYTVPQAIVLTRFAYELIQQENPKLVDEVKRVSAQIGQGHLDNLEADCERLQKMLVDEIRFPRVLREQLEKQLKLIAGKEFEERPYAVRSSSWGEDEADMSAAGQLDTILSVKGLDSLVVAILRCFSSKFSKTNMEYKRLHGLPLDLPMAVVLQEMVDCEKAGVMFTCDPTTGDPNCTTITANYGLGESVVSGQTTPDSIKVHRVMMDSHLEKAKNEEQFEIVELKVGQKDVVLGELGNKMSGEQLGDRSKCCCLSNEEIMELARCGHRLMRYFNSGPRDMEWGYKGGQLYLFQSRPVTGLDSYSSFELQHEADTPSKAQLEFASRANVGEVMPIANTPISLSYAVKSMIILVKRFTMSLRVTKADDYNLFCNSDGFIRSYHYFFGLRSPTMVNFARQPDGTRPLLSKALEVGLFGHEVNNPELEERATEMVSMEVVRFREFWFDWVTWRMRYMSRRVVSKLKLKMKRLRRDVQSLRFTGKSGASLEGLYRQCQVIFRSFNSTFSNHYCASLLSSKFNYELLQLLSKYVQDPAKLYAHLSKFLALSKDVLSAEIPHRINRMAELIRQRGPKDVARFVEMSPQEALKFVSSDLKSELSKEFDTFMVKFGHRSYCEFEIAQTPWRDSPELIMEMLQSNVRGSLNLKKDSNCDDNNNQKKCNSLDEVIQSLGIEFSPSDRLKLKLLLVPRCVEFVANRERTKDLLIESIDIMRDATSLLAKALRQSNRIPDEQLFHYFFYHELEPLVRGPQPTLVVQAQQRRRMFAMFTKQPWRFDEIIKDHDPLPIHLRPSKELDEQVMRAPKLMGTTTSSGRVRGKVCLVEGYEQLKRVEEGGILVTYSTDIAFSPIFPIISGIVTEVGGIISHGAVVAREYGLPSVIGVPEVTKILQHGEEIILDADNGVIIRLGHN